MGVPPCCVPLCCCHGRYYLHGSPQMYDVYERKLWGLRRQLENQDQMMRTLEREHAQALQEELARFDARIDRLRGRLRENGISDAIATPSAWRSEVSQDA